MDLTGRGEMRFEDRKQAGKKLAERLMRYRDESVVVFALPRGGVPVGFEVARALAAPLEVIVARKLGAPGQPELGIGAVAPDGVRVLNERVAEQIGVGEDYLDWITAREREEVERRMEMFGGASGEGSVSSAEGRIAILVDDGLATGVTARAAIESLRRQGPRCLILGVPVCAAQTAESIRPNVDELLALKLPPDLGAIGFWYLNFEQVPDEEVCRLLDDARRLTG